MGKSWHQKLVDAPPPHTAVVRKPFAGLQPGDTIFIASPLMVRDYMCAIPSGDCRTIAQMREDFAAQNGAQATCPLTASLFARIVAEAALEEMARGRDPNAITPFWRVIEADGAIGKRLSCGSAFVRRMRAAEASTVQPSVPVP